MKAAPKVTAIIPCYNAEKFIRDSIQSVLDQSFQDFELLVLNDGSKDSSEKLIRAFADPRVQLLSKPNSGVADTRNQGISRARGEYVAFLDADDLYLSENLAQKVRFLDENPEHGLVHSEVYFLEQDGSLRPRGLRNCQGSVLKPLLEFRTMVNSPSSAVIRRELLERVGGFDIRLSTSADRDLWIRLAAVTKFGFLGDPLVKYRLHPGQMHHNIDAMEADLKVIYEKAREQKLFESPGHYQRCRAKAEKVIGASYLRHTWKLHKAAKHFLNAGIHGALGLLSG